MPGRMNSSTSIYEAEFRAVKEADRRGVVVDACVRKSHVCCGDAWHCCHSLGVTSHIYDAGLRAFLSGRIDVVWSWMLVFGSLLYVVVMPGTAATSLDVTG